MKVLNLFPDEFKRGYVAYKSGRLRPEGTATETIGGYRSSLYNDSGWWLLDP
jgi:hypothetical protein